MYYFVDWKKLENDEGFEPDLPVEVSFKLVVDNLGEFHSWGVFEADIEDDESFLKVSSTLQYLLYSASRFPPAYAISKNEMEDASKRYDYSKEDFDTKYCEIIESIIEKCRNKSYVFAKAKVDEIGYMANGEYFWLLSATTGSQPEVNWVSDDFYIYNNPACCFELTEQELWLLQKNA